MGDRNKTRAQLIEELAHLRQRIAKLEAADSAKKPANADLAHSQRLLLALSHAAQAVQRARAPADVYRAIGEQAGQLGFEVTVFSLSDDRSYLSISYLTLQSKLLQIAEKLTGLTVTGYRLPLTPENYYQQIITNGEAVFSYLDVTPFAEALPRALRPLAERLAGLFNWQQSIIAPLASGDEIQGLMIINGNTLTETDVPAVTVFANQAAIALENARLYKEMQSLAEFNENIIQNTAEGIVVENTAGIFTFVNPAAADMLGYTRDELVGQHWTTIIPPNHHALIQAANERRRRGETHRYETELMHRDKQRIPVLVSGSPQHDAEGQFAGTIAVFTDISGRQQAEAAREAALEAAKKSELQYRTTINAMGDAIHLIDANLRLTLVNSACQQLAQEVAQGPADLVGLSIFEAFPTLPKDVCEKLREEYELVFRTGEALITEETLSFENRVFITETRKIPTFEKGKVTQIVTVIRDITKRKQAQQKLRQSERRYRQLFENSRDGFVFIDAEGRFIDANPAYCQMLGYTLEELRQKTDFYEITPARWRDWEREEIWEKSLLQQGYSGIYEKEYIRKHGTVFPVELQSYTIFAEQGGPDYLWGIARDITDRKHTEEALRESEEKYRLLAETTHDIILLQNMEGHIMYINQAALDLAGFKSPDVIGRNIKDFIADKHLDDIDMHRAQRLAGDQSTYRYETEFVNRAGEHIPMEVYSTPVLREGEIQGILIVARDITERKQAEEERARLTAQMQQILATVPAGILLLDARGQVLQANPSAEKDLPLLTGISFDAGLQHDSEQVITYLGNRSLVELLTSPPTKGLWHEVKVDRQIFEVISQPVEAGSEPEHWVLVLNNVTQERQIRAQLQQQERLAAVGQLAAGIAHDFNNIMASIVLYAQMVARLQTLSQRDRERMEVIIQQTWHASRLIQQILDFSRRAVLELRPVDLLPLIKEQVKLLTRTLPEHIEITLDYDPVEYIVNADPTRVQQMLMNLAVNARDAMLHGGNLRIGLARLTLEPEQSPPLPDMTGGTWICLTVSDTGTGIAPDVLPHIFEPFFTTKEPGAGSGLGLSQVHGIVGLHKGYMDVKTQGGKGTTFTIYLPALGTRSAEQLVRDKSITTQGQGESVLVVEDEATLRAALSETLELLNYETLQAANGQEALAIMETRGKEIALVLSDVVMPGMGGMALFHALRDKGWLTPVILLTGHPLDKELNALQAQGVHTWLSKPPNIEDLAQAIADALHE